MGVIPTTATPAFLKVIGEDMKQLKLMVFVVALLCGMILPSCVSTHHTITSIPTTDTTKLDVRQFILSITVHLKVAESDGMKQGSGVMLEEWLILTARHMTEDDNGQPSTAYEVVGNNHKWSVYKRSKNYDLALLISDDPRGEARWRGLGKTLDIGQFLYHAGFPKGVGPYLTSGYLSVLDDLASSSHLGYPGCSGGGVFNEQGQLVGIHVRWWHESFMSLFEPLDHVRKFLQEE